MFSQTGYHFIIPDRLLKQLCSPAEQHARDRPTTYSVYSSYNEKFYIFRKSLHGIETSNCRGNYSSRNSTLSPRGELLNTCASHVQDGLRQQRAIGNANRRSIDVESRSANTPTHVKSILGQYTKTDKLQSSRCSIGSVNPHIRLHRKNPLSEGVPDEYFLLLSHTSWCPHVLTCDFSASWRC